VGVQGASGLSDSASVLQLSIRDSDIAFVEDIGGCSVAFLGLHNFVGDAVDAGCWDVC
jgi:hypothetical protein